MKHEKTTYLLWLCIALSTAALGCSNKTKDKEAEACPDTAKPDKSDAVSRERLPVSKADKADRDWCRACVVGPHGFMSCQRVSAESDNESRGALMARARAKACEDSGFPKESCPDANVIALSCKGDQPPKDKTAAAKSMLKALKNSGPLILKKPDGTPLTPPQQQKAPENKAPAQGEKAPEQPETQSKTPVPVV